MSPLGLFEGFGVEIEVMIVDAQSLDARPLTDEVLKAVCGRYESEVELGELNWSNELVLHVIELKTNGPAHALEPLADLFHRDLGKVREHLVPLGARLMPTGMHPWFDPARETKLWPHEHNAVYESYDRIFGCQGHGWSNLQSTHVNLPFRDDAEFGRLHAAIRVLLPVLPALAASTPLKDGAATGFLDSRLEVYRTNQRKIPSLAGRVIPEPVFTRADYGALLRTLYRDIAPFDPENILQYEWLNSRGAIARFDRNTIEIRVLDTQECARADLSVVAAVTAAIRALTEERWAGLRDQQGWAVEPLADLFVRCVRDAEAAVIDDAAYLQLFGLKKRATAGELWAHLIGTLLPDGPWSATLKAITGRGTLSRRILAALEAGGTPREVYRALCDCLDRGQVFTP